MSCQMCARRGLLGRDDLPPKRDRHGKAHCATCGVLLRTSLFTAFQVTTLIKAVREEKAQCPVRVYTSCEICTNPVCKALRVFDYMT